MAGASTDLSGRRIVLTRPAGRLEGISSAIASAGGVPVPLPLIQIRPLTAVDETERIKQCILQLDRYDMAVFVSSNAADIGMDWIDRYWPQLPQGLEAFTVGPGTAEVLRRWQWPVWYPEQGVTSEALLALPQLQDVDGSRVLIFRGKGGRELIAGTLRERGATVDYVELYSRDACVLSPARVCEALSGADAVVVTSAQILQTYAALLNTLAVTTAGAARALPLLLPSERVAQQAESLGFRSVINAGGASDPDVLQALQELFNQHNRRIEGNTD